MCRWSFFSPALSSNYWSYHQLYFGLDDPEHFADNYFQFSHIIHSGYQTMLKCHGIQFLEISRYLKCIELWCIDILDVIGCLLLHGRLWQWQKWQRLYCPLLAIGVITVFDNFGSNDLIPLITRKLITALTCCLKDYNNNGTIITNSWPFDFAVCQSKVDGL